jgi:hypothetical protein
MKLHGALSAPASRKLTVLLANGVIRNDTPLLSNAATIADKERKVKGAARRSPSPSPAPAP